MARDHDRATADGTRSVRDQIRALIQESSVEVEVAETAPEVTIARVHQVVILVWHSRPTLELIGRVSNYLGKTSARFERVVMFVIIEPTNTKIPGSAEREALAALTKKFEPLFAGIAIVLDGKQPHLAIVRLSLSTVLLLTSTRFPQVVFDTLEAASRWAATQLPGVSATELTRTIGRLRALRPD